VKSPILHTERLTLDRPGAADAPGAVAFLMSDRARFMGGSRDAVAAEAARAARDWAFGSLGWATVAGHVHLGNHRSARLAGRLGAVRDPAAASPFPPPVDTWRHLAPIARMTTGRA